MQNFRINFLHPWLLLLLIPAIALTLLPYFRANKKYRKTRNRILSMVFHGLAITLAITLLAGITFSYEKPNLENELIVLVDNTDSNDESAELKSDFVQSIISISDGKYRVGVVTFGHGQVLAGGEMSYDIDKLLEDYLTSEVPDSSATDIASALKYARSLFKNPETSKIVLVSDGIETDNAATSVIKAIAADGVKVDTVLYPNEEHDEIQIHSVKTPDTRIILGDDFVTELTLKSNLKGENKATIVAYDNDELIGYVEVVLDGSEQTFEIALSLDERGMHELRFEVQCEDDTVEQNNAYHVYINLEAFDNVLLIEHKEGEGKRLADILNEKFVVTDISISDDLAEMPRTIEQMAQYEQIILVNVAYSDMPAGFEELLNQYVYQLGGGLFTVGGELDDVGGVKVPHAYNRNDIAASTYFKQMLPINAIDYTPPIAVIIVVDASASMSMGKLDAAKEGAEGCLDALQDRDFCGVMSFQTRASEELEILPVSERDLIRDTIRDIGGEDDDAHGGTIFSDAIMRAGRALSVITNVERKHIILVTDGNPGDTYDTYLPYIEDNLADGITMSIVTIDNTDNSLAEKMRDSAEAGGGSYYNVPYSQMQQIPEIMRQDLALEAVAEINYGEPFNLTIKDRTAAVAGIDEIFIPQLSGYYGTVAKKDASVALMGKYVPIYAEWKYGNGSVGSFMCDLSGIWSDEFMSDLVGQAIITNIVNSLFPVQDLRADGIDYVIKSDNYHYQLNVHGVGESERIEVEVTPMSDRLVSTLEEGVTVSALESNRRFNFIIKDAGLYEIVIKKYDEAGVELARVVTYECFSYSEEYNMFTDKAPIGEELMTLLADDGKGMVVSDPAEVFESFAQTIKKVIDPRVAFLILSIIFVLLDIAARKFKFKWPHEIYREYKFKKADEAAKND